MHTHLLARSRRGLLSVLALLAGVAILSVGGGSARADVIGCSTGWACIINPNPKPIGTTEAEWYYYGWYDLSHQLGQKYVCNQQTGGALLRLYSGYGASGKVLYTLRPVDGGHGNGCKLINVSPVNSVKLSPN